MGTKPFTSTDAEFLQACERADVKVTKRQWRKWCRKFGSAYLRGRAKKLPDHPQAVGVVETARSS